MLKTSLIAFLALTVPAAAHPGHLADAGQGHGHWIALAAVAGAAVVGAVALVRRARSRRAAHHRHPG
jgi:hypothetical protein